MPNRRRRNSRRMGLSIIIAHMAAQAVGTLDAPIIGKTEMDAIVVAREPTIGIGVAARSIEITDDDGVKFTLSYIYTQTTTYKHTYISTHIPNTHTHTHN